MFRKDVPVFATWGRNGNREGEGVWGRMCVHSCTCAHVDRCRRLGLGGDHFKPSQNKGRPEVRTERMLLFHMNLRKCANQEPRVSLGWSHRRHHSYKPDMVRRAPQVESDMLRGASSSRPVLLVVNFPRLPTCAVHISKGPPHSWGCVVASVSFSSCSL